MTFPRLQRRCSVGSILGKTAQVRPAGWKTQLGSMEEVLVLGHQEPLEWHHGCPQPLPQEWRP